VGSRKCGYVDSLDEMLEQCRIDFRQGNLAFVACSAKGTRMVTEERCWYVPRDKVCRGTDNDLYG
jgi:hypothetical protein